MTGHALLLAAALAVPGDRWFARDKLKHFFVAAFTQSVAYSAARLTGAEHRASLVAASVATAAASVGKEVADRRRGGPFSGKDLVWDAAGGLAATVVLDRVRR